MARIQYLMAHRYVGGGHLANLGLAPWARDMPLYRNNWISIPFWIGVLIAFCFSSVTYNAWRIALHRHDYRRSLFTVASVNYYPGMDPVPYWTAHGRIGDAEEDMSLTGVIPTPHNQADLERLVPAGTQFEVWYDPSATHWMTQFVYLRVLPRKLYDFDNALAYAVLVTAILDGLPVVVGGLLIGSFIRSRFIPRAET